MSTKNPFTPSERKGVIIIAAIALLITGIGLIPGFNDGGSTSVAPEVEIIVPQDSVTSGHEKNRKVKKRKNSDGSTGKKQKVKKPVRKRNPLDEPV